MRNKYALKDIRTGFIEYVGLSAGEVQQIIGIPSQRVSFYMHRNMIFQATWKVMLDDDDYSEFWTDELCMQWDCIRKMVLGGFRRGKGTYEEKLERWRKRARKEKGDEKG